MRRAVLVTAALPLLASCSAGTAPAASPVATPAATADARCDPGGERAALLDADPALRTAPPGQEQRERVAVAATYDAVKTFDCNEQLLLVDLAPVGEPRAALALLQRHLEDGGWTVTAVDPQLRALTATRELAPSLVATLRADVDPARGSVRLAAALPPAVVDPD